MSRTIQSAIRHCDMVVRYGGDEFVVLLNNAAESVGGKIAERIRSLIAETLHGLSDGKQFQVTVSVGWTTMVPDSKISSAKELPEIADACLYSAKAGGRNKISQVS